MAATGFVTRFKGKIAHVWAGVYQSGGQAITVFWKSGAPTNGTSGTLVNIAPAGALLATDEPALYQNTGSISNPTWTAAPLTGAAGITSGTINGAVIGGSAPAAATVTKLTAVGATGTGGAAGDAQAITGGVGGATGAGGAASLTAGAAGATSGTGGAASVTGGASGGTTGTGGAASLTGGAGSGASVGGAATVTAGQGGATGAGGVAGLVGGAGGASSGTGGAASVTAGAGTNGNASGGSVVLTGGAKNGSGIAGGVRVESVFVRQVAAPTAMTVSATLTAAQLLAGMVTVLQGGGAASAQQLPTGTAIQNALPADFATGDSFDVSLINISSTGAEVASFTVNTDVTIVGNAAVDAIGAGNQSSGLFRFRKTGDHVFVAYRIA